jgi:leader peptidase (prepilin peptidase) / N-methyltransferase
MDSVALLFWILSGAAVGSFLNVAIDRLPTGGSLVVPPSHCEQCGQRLTAMHLIPVVSFLVLRGRCRTCQARIPIRVLLVEAGTALLFGWTWLRYGWGVELWLAVGYGCLLLVVAVIDLEHHRILNRLSYPGIAAALLILPWSPFHRPVGLLLGGLVAGGMLLLIALAAPAGMGLGDIKLGVLIGLIVGFPEAALAVMLAFVLGGTIMGGLLLARRVRRKTPVPFGPFLAAGGFVALLYGPQMIQWWLERV